MTPTATADAAADMMRLKGIHHLVVVDDGRLVGVISAGDRLLNHRAPHRKRHSATGVW